MPRLNSYLPKDRLLAIANGTSLPTHTNGSALFADISGFTPLTEKLTQQLGPRRGIETLTQLINTVYTALISEIEYYGGNVIGFAGDAITCWFNESDGESAARAEASAQGMQSAMQAFPELSVKIALTTGAAHRIVVGDPNIQLIDTLAGATIARLATGEHLTNSGEILLDESTENILQHPMCEWRMAETGERFAVIETKNVPVSTAPLNKTPLPLFLDKLKPWIPSAVYERENQGHGFFLTELRPAVALFIRFMGIDYDNDEQAGEKLNTIIQRSQGIAAEHEGILLQLTIGDKGSYLYICFGAVLAHEDDAQRAVHTAIRINQFLKGCEFLESHQMGLSSGVMRTGAYGSRSRQTYGALGDDVNLAARLMTKAASGEILISSRVQKMAAKEFIVEPRPSLLVKGKSEPIHIFAVTGKNRERAMRLTEPAYRLPMIGRQAELSIADEKLESAMQSKGQVIGITAEAGMGKSRLVAEIIRLARKRGFTGYGGACQSSGTNTPYLAWQPIWQAFFDLDPEMPQRKQIRLLEGEIEEHAPERVEALPLLGSLLDLPLPDNDFTRTLEPKDRKSTLEVLLEECLKSAAVETPLLIILEDLHWIDPLSNDLLETLTRISENIPVCFVLAYRPPDRVRYQMPRVENLPYFTKIEIKYLTASDAEELIRAKLAQLFPERNSVLPKILVDELTSKAQGNPFYIEEIINYIHDRGLNPYDTQAFETLELPTSLQTLILSRIDQLTEPQKITLKVASVIGRVFPFSWLYGYYPSLGEENIVKANLAELSKVDLTPLDTPDPELAYVFKHIITQEVAYETLSYATRTQLHEVLARYLEATHPDDPPLDALAFHYNHSKNLPKKREYLRRSAEAAYAVYSNTTALEYYRQALALSPERDKLNELIEMRIKSGEIFQMIGKREDAFEHYKAALDIAEENSLTEKMIECQIKIASTCREYQRSLDWLEKAYQLANQTNNMAGRCDAFNEISNIQRRLGNYESALQNSQAGLDIARQIGDRKKEGDALFFLASIYSDQGKYAESHHFFESVLAIRRELNDARRIGAVLLNWGNIYYYEGNYEIAQKHISESLNYYREIGDKRHTTIALNNLGNIFYLDDDYQKARKYYTESLTLGRELDDQYTMSIALASLGITAFQEGSLEEADACYQEGMALSRAINHKVTMALLSCYQGLLAITRGQISAARISFQEGLTVAHESDIKIYIVYNLVGYGGVYLAEGKPAHAVQLLSAASSIAGSIGLKMEPEIERPYTSALASAKDKLLEAEFISAQETGAKMGIEQAVQFTLKDAGESE